jgi:hypothetical protein
MNQIASRIKFPLSVLTATLVLTSQLPKADAALIPNVIKDTLTELEVLWSWNPEASDFSTPTLTNWLVTLNTSDFRDPNSWDVNLDVQHITAPHPELGENQGGFVFKDYSFSKNDFGLVISDSFSASHPPVHRDFYTFSFDRSMAPANTVIKLTGVHTPEPSSILSLLALGTLGAASTLKRKLKSSKSTEKDTTKVG